jgi:hypothetical protein
MADLPVLLVEGDALTDLPTIREFLRRLAHRVVLVGLGERTRVIWPVEQDDPADSADWLSRQSHSVYVNLNPLEPYMESVAPHMRDPHDQDDIPGSVRDAMIARRTHLLIDVDGHDCPKEEARDQKDAIKARYGPPLIETDSGRGYGLIYNIDYPNDHDAKQRVRKLLKNLKADYPCVDHGVFNAARLTRLIGTPNRSIPTQLLN